MFLKIIRNFETCRDVLSCLYITGFNIFYGMFGECVVHCLSS